MKTAQVIYENGDHRWLAIVRDPDRPGYLIDTNEYLVSVGEDAILLDPKEGAGIQRAAEIRSRVKCPVTGLRELAAGLATVRIGIHIGVTADLYSVPCR